MHKCTQQAETLGGPQ